MLTDWHALSDTLQLTLARQALEQATEIIATQAESLAGVMEDGELQDRGGPDALRLLAAIVRALGTTPPGVAGHA